MRKHLTILILSLAACLWITAARAGNPDTEMAIREGVRQYQRLVAYNEANKRAGHPEKNIYVFSFDPQMDFMDRWVAYKSINQKEKDEFGNAFLTNLNHYLTSYNTKSTATHEVYVCLVSNFVVKLNKEVNGNLTTQTDVIASLKSAYETSKSNRDNQSIKNYESYRTAYENEVKAIINGIFKDKKPNHIITTSVSYHQFNLEGTNKLATYLRATRYLRVSDSKLSGDLVKYLNAQVSDTTHLLNSSNVSEREIEQKIIRICAYLSRSQPTQTSTATIDIDKLNQETAQRREQNWNTDIDNLAKEVDNAYRNGNVFVTNTELAISIGLESYMSIFDDKFRFLKQKTGIHFLVAFTKVDYTIPDFKKEEFASTALSKATAANGKNVVLITIPVYQYTDLAGKNINVASPGYASPTGVLDDNFERSYKIVEYILNAYKHLPKPHRQYVYTIHTNGTVVPNVIDSEGDVKGFGAIEEVVILKSKYLLQMEQLTYPQCTNPYSGCLSDPVYWERMRAYDDRRMQLLLDGTRAEISQPEESYTLINHGNKLKESRIKDLHDSYFYYSSKSGLGQWFSDLGTVINVTTITSEDYYNFDGWSVVDPIIYTAIDIAGIIPLIDNFADGAGLLYATARGNLDQMQNYTIALAMVGGGAVLVKGTKKLYAVIIRKNADNVVEVITKEVSQASDLADVPAREVATVIPSSGNGDDIRKAFTDELKIRNPDLVIPSIPWSDRASKLIADANIGHLPFLLDFPKLLARSDLSDEAFQGFLKLAENLKPDQLKKLASKIDNLGDAAPKFLEDLYGDLSKNLDWNKLDEGLVESWKIVKDAPEAVRRNSSVLESISTLSTKKLPNGNALDVKKLFDNGLSRTLTNASEANKSKILSRISEWDASKVDDLARRLGDSKYSGLADELADPDFFKLYDEIIHDPENAIDIAKQGGDALLDKVGRSTFFHEITDLGRKFENKILNDLLDNTSATYKKLKELVPDLADRKVLSQVQFCVPGKTAPCNAKGEYFIADAVFIKYDSRGRIVDMVITDSKLSQATSLTSGQMLAKNGVGQQLTVRSGTRTRDAVEELLPGSGIEQNTEITIKNFYKIYGDGKGIFQGIE